MSRIARYSLILVVLLGLSCNLITQPIADVQNLAETAEALGSQAPDFATMIANATGIPGIPGMPDTSACLDITGSAASTWNDLPILPDATAGNEADTGLYCYVTPSSVADVATFYNDQLGPLGWTTGFSAPEMGEIAFLMYNKNPQTLIISIVHDGNATTVALTLR